MKSTKKKENQITLKCTTEISCMTYHILSGLKLNDLLP